MQSVHTRSSESLAFETLWRSLSKERGIPSRESFQPRLAKPFLPNLILLTAPSTGDQTLRVRLVGDHIVRQIGRDIVGDDYLEFLGSERREGALAVLRAMFDRPCGAWWVAVVHYERGFSQCWEMTAFPLESTAGGRQFVLGLVCPADAVIDRQRTGHTAIRVAAPTEFQAIPVELSHRRDELRLERNH